MLEAVANGLARAARTGAYGLGRHRFTGQGRTSRTCEGSFGDGPKELPRRCPAVRTWYPVMLAEELIADEDLTAAGAPSAEPI
jgi:hypothetical protein